MKTKTIITELTQEDLVNLLCTATYGSDWLNIYADFRKREKVATEDDCREDIWAKILLAGDKVSCTDYYADESVYGNLAHKIDEEGNVIYELSLQGILDGLQKCADGTFKVASSNYNNYGENERKFVARCYNDFVNDGDGWDYTEADALMQIILFGELIYG
jgi:hypothetical protein